MKRLDRIIDGLAIFGTVSLTLCAAALVLIVMGMVAGCEYSGHSVKAQMGRRIGETVAGTEYSIGTEVQFKAKR